MIQVIQKYSKTIVCILISLNLDITMELCNNYDKKRNDNNMYYIALWTGLTPG